MKGKPRFTGSVPGATDVTDSPPTSVLLPTDRWTDACGEIVDQLRDIDELPVIHDEDDDLVAAGRTSQRGSGSLLPACPKYARGRPTPLRQEWKRPATIA